MAAPKGTMPPGAGKGRPAGTPNKVTTAVKEMIVMALDNAGGLDYLTRQAEENPKAFLSLLGRVLPLQVTGDADSPLVVQVVKFGEQK